MGQQRGGRGPGLEGPGQEARAGEGTGKEDGQRGKAKTGKGQDRAGTSEEALLALLPGPGPSCCREVEGLIRP